MAEPALLGIDLGTSGAKAVVLGVDGAVRGEAQRGYAVRAAGPGWAETPPDDWSSAVAAAVRAALAAAGGPTVAAVGLDGQMHGLVLLDTAGRAVRDALLWADGRAGAEVGRWAGLGGSAVERLGNPLVPGMTGPLWSWVARHEPDVLAAARWAVLPKDWLHAQLTGEVATDPSDGSATLLWDVAADGWAVNVAAALGLEPRLLPPLRGSAETDPLSRAGAELLGLPDGVPVTVGCGDVAAGLLATGLSGDDAQVTVGSGAQTVRPLDRPVAAGRPVVHTYRTAAPRGWYAMAAVQNAGLALERVSAWLGAGWDELYGSLGRTAPGAGGVTFLPYVTGERLPAPTPGGRASWTGMSLGSARDDLLRAALEGVVFQVASALAALPGPPPRSVLLAGGGARDAGFRQLLADACGVPLVPLTGAGSAVGAARLAARSIGLDVAPSAARSTPVEPGPRAPAYDEARARFADVVAGEVAADHDAATGSARGCG